MENMSTCVVDNNGTKRWYLNDELHREDGPAVEYQRGIKCWYLNGNYHRLDGPAIVNMRDSENYGLWYINGNNITDEITKWASDNYVDFDNLSEDDKLLIKLVTYLS